MSIAKRLAQIDSIEAMDEVHKWVDSIPLSRPKRNIARDFADGVLVAEVISHYHPSLVELHNYPSSSSFSQKMYNWDTLNGKVFKKLGFCLNTQDMEDCANVISGSIEKVLLKIRSHLQKVPPRSSRPGSGRPPAKSVEVIHQRSPKASSSLAQAYSVEEMTRLLYEQDAAMSDLRKTVEILTQKNLKLEQLMEIKDKKIEALATKLKATTTGI